MTALSAMTDRSYRRLPRKIEVAEDRIRRRRQRLPPKDKIRRRKTELANGMCETFALCAAAGGADGAAEVGEGGDDGGPPGGELVVAEGAVVGLEDRANEE
jgi:hypothetical protein